MTTENTGGYFGDRSTGNGAGVGLLSRHRRQLRRLQRHRPGGARLPRPDAVGSLLPRPDRPRVHHRQSGSRARKPACRCDLAAALYGAALPRRRLLLPLPHRRPDRALLDGHRFLLLPQPRRGPHPRLRGRGAGRCSATGSRSNVAAQVAEGRALDDDAYLDDISPVTFSASLRKQFGDASLRARCASRISRTTTTSGRPSGPSPATRCSTPPAASASSKPLELRVHARNLLNEEYYASQDVRTVFAPGRSASLVGAVKF